MRLDALLTQVVPPGGSGLDPVRAGHRIDDLTLDSREVRPGTAFLACRGDRHHGLDFLDQVLARGASAVLWEPVEGRAAPRVPDSVAAVAVPHLREQASRIAAHFFGEPSARLRVIGVTGTNGKTTCAWLLAQALARCGRPAAYIGTLGAGRVGAGPDDGVLSGTHTTPDAITLQRLLAGFRDEGMSHVAIEVSSHALVQGRAAAVRFAAAVLTNLTRDHLDYHGTMESYAAAKALLFARDEVSLRVVNADDAFGRSLLARYGDAIAISTDAGAAQGAFAGRSFLCAREQRLTGDGMSFLLESSFGTRRMRSPLIGAFNLANAVTVLGVLLGLGVSIDEAAAQLATLQPPPGRMQRFGGGAAPLVVVDYAHTPDALDKALHALRAHCPDRLWCVFGCGGDRDRGKRAPMGAIAARLADELVITDDNPRTESPAAIARDILDGVGAHPARVIHDRAAAIAFAVRSARPGDAVLVAGKGHESVQIVGTGQRPFSDAAAVATALTLDRAGSTP
jgi:UDP-N-acetylmuramoyl-L-alanyl-D-glutamate--2,6-diaminopimelate ligase